MTDDDRQDTREGGAQGEDEVGTFLGGLLDGLPESGRGAGGEAPTNPFRDPGPVSGGPFGQEPDPSSPTGHDAPAPEARTEREGDPEPGTQAGYRVTTDRVPSDVAPGSRTGHVPWGPTSGEHGTREAQGAQENDESAGTGSRHAPGTPVADVASSGASGPDVYEDARVADALTSENATHETQEERENVSASAAPAGGQVPGTNTSPDPSGVPRAGAAAPPATELRSTDGAQADPGLPEASANTMTGGVGGTGGHVVPAVAGGHASGTDGNTEPYGVRAHGTPAAFGNTGADTGSGVVEESAHAEERSLREGTHGVNSAPDDAGEPMPPEGARDVSEARVSTASGDAGSPGGLSATQPAGGEDTDPHGGETPGVPGALGLPAEATPTQTHPGRARVSGGQPHTPATGVSTREGARTAAPTDTPAGVVRGDVLPAPAVPAGPVDQEPTAAALEQPGQAYADAEREALYRAVREPRDAHVGFRSDPVADDLLTRILEAAHRAPSVGHTKPWDFLVIDDRTLRTRVHDLARDEREEYARARSGTGAQTFYGLEVEAILEAPLNIAVTVDPTRGPHHTPGHHTGPMSVPHSAVLAVENLWFAARAEGLGVGRIRFIDERAVARALDLPPHLDVVAYLCVGHVDEFPSGPELGLGGRVKERPLSWAVHHNRYGRRGLPGQEPTSLLEETIAAIGGLSARAVEEARDRQRRMTKPEGALGVLEEVSVRLAGLSGECPPPIPEPAAVAIFAGDHGVHAQGVTPWPQEVTAQMVHTFLSGGAVVNAFAEQVGADVTVVDVGVAADLPSAPGLLPRKVAHGTADSTQGPAMTRPQALQALETGIEVARDLVAAGHRCLVTGDMGIANTTPSAALICAYTGAAPEDATGKGAGADEKTHSHKVDVVRRMLAANPVDPSDPVGTLAALGGSEHAALAGFVLGGAAMRVPVLLDGVIAGSSALAAVAISPESAAACFAGHRSSEPGHAAALEHLGLPPLVDLEMRVGEGSGALLALPMLQASARALRSVATFEDSGIISAG